MDDSGSNVSEEMHAVRCGRGVRRVVLHAVPFADGTAESGTQTLNAQVMPSDDSSYQVGSSDTASITILDPPSDNSIAVIDVTRSSDQSSVAEGETIIYTFTRSGGDTTQPLTIDVGISDPGSFLRGTIGMRPRCSLPRSCSGQGTPARLLI